MFFVLALIAGTFTTFGQTTEAVPGSLPRDLDSSCQGSPLNPIPGVPYIYSATVTPGEGTAYWWAQFSIMDFITAGVRTPGEDQEAVGGDFIESAERYQTNLTLSGDQPDTTSTEITWKTDGLSQVDENNPLFVALHYNAPATACADNLKIYRIVPILPFQVNVIALRPDDADPEEFPEGYGLGQESCFDEVFTARYDLENECMIYHYGYNVMQFEVVGAYFDESYQSFFRIDGLKDGQTADVYWSYENIEPDFETATAFATDLGNGNFDGPVVKKDASVTNTANGVSIYVWLRINNNTHEGLSAVPIYFFAAGETQTGLDTNGDAIMSPNVRWDDCDVDVVITAEIGANNAADYGIHTLNERPTIEERTPQGDGDFEEPCGTGTTEP